jgi:hypothetical protein
MRSSRNTVKRIASADAWKLGHNAAMLADPYDLNDRGMTIARLKASLIFNLSGDYGAAFNAGWLHVVRYDREEELVIIQRNRAAVRRGSWGRP